MPKSKVVSGWKVGDVIYFRWRTSAYFQERVIVDETPRSWLVLPKDSSAYQADKTHWQYPKYCGKLPKSGKSHDGDTYEVGTKMSMGLARWTAKHRDDILHKLRWSELAKDSMFLRDLAQSLGLNEIVATYPTEVKNEEQPTTSVLSNAGTVEAAVVSGTSQA